MSTTPAHVARVLARLDERAIGATAREPNVWNIDCPVCRLPAILRDVNWPTAAEPDQRKVRVFCGTCSEEQVMAALKLRERDMFLRYGPGDSLTPGGVVDGVPSTTWTPLDLGPIVEGLRSGRIVGPVPSLMVRSDGVALLYPGEVHSLAGEPETGKGWMVLATCAAVLASETASVLYLDFEDAPPSIVGRLMALGVADDAIVDRFIYQRPADPFSAEEFYRVIKSRPFSLAVIDGVSEAYSLLGLDPYSNPDAARFLASVPRPLAATGAAVLEVDHVIKAKDARGRYAIGAQHKLAGVASAYSTEVVRAPSRTTDGLIKLKVEKDRHGHVRGHASGGVIAFVHIRPRDDGAGVSVTFDPPDAAVEAAAEFRPTALMEKTSRFLEDEPGANRRAIRSGVQGNTRWADEALRLLIAEGHVEVRQHGAAREHHVIRPYRQVDDPADRDHVTKPCAGRDQNTVVRDRDHVTPPIGARVTEHTRAGAHKDRDRDHDDEDLIAEAERILAKHGGGADE